MNLLDSFFKVDLGEGAFYSVFGYVFVIVGIVILVAIFTLLGLVMKKVSSKKAPKNAKIPDVRESTPHPFSDPDEISPETVAAITAALMAFYQTEDVKCDFIVRRIKKI